VFDKTEAIARCMDEHEYSILWLAEHHFQHEGYECIPNIMMVAVHLAHLTTRLRIGCGFNITPMWHPLDYSKVGAWFAGTPEEFVAHLRSLEGKYPGLEYIHVSNSMGTPQSAMLEQLAWFAKEVKPHFANRK
jgi:hypothetical protein